jgi:hypothetical protein
MVYYMGKSRQVSEKLDSCEADAAQQASSSDLLIRAAYKDGLSTCSAEDEATFHDVAEKMQSKMEATSNPYKYLMFKYLYNYMYDWSDSWAYSDEETQKMTDEYMMGDVEFQ